MVTERPKQSVQSFLNSNEKPFFGNKSPTELCEELDDAIRCLNSTIGKPYIDSFDYSGVGNLERFLTENKDDPNLKFVLNLTRGEPASTVLHYVADFNAVAVDLLLKAGADPNIYDENRKSAIQYVIDSAYKDYTNIKHYVYIIELLVRAGADPNVRGQNQKSAIECVIDSAYTDRANIYYYPYIIELLVEAGADQNAQSQDRRVLDIVIAATDGFNKDECIKVVKLLVAAGVDINLMDESSGQTLLHHAAATGKENIVELLLQSTEGEKRTQLINAQDDNGNTPLHCAVESSGYSSVVELLLEYGASYTIQNSQGEMPLHVATQKNDRRNIEPFFRKDLDINVRNGDGATPLLIASRFGSAVIIESFLEHDADANAKDKHNNTALHYAANHERTNNDEECNQLFDESNKYRPEADNEVEDNVKIIQNLIAKGVDVNDKNEYGHTPLFFAVEHRKCSNTKLLLKSGTDVNIADENGFTVFHFATRQKELHALKTLLPKKTIKENELCSPTNDENDSSIEEVDTEEAKKLLSVIDNEGNTLLHHAIKWGCDEEILSFLIKYGVDINKKNNYGIAPIHIAAKYGGLSQINFLINRGADLNVRCDIISRSVINNIGREKELSDDSTDTYIHIQDNTVDVNNTEHTKATSLAIVTEDSSRSNVTTFLSAGGNQSIADGRNWLPLHIAIKRASEEGCTEEEREERLEIVRSLASSSHVESLVSQGIDEKSEIWKGQFFEEVKNSLTDALEVTDNEKVQKEVAKAFCDLMLQVTRNKEEINRILEDAIESRNGGKSPSAPVFDEDFYDLIGSHVKKPTIYHGLFEELVGGDDWMDKWDLQGDHEGLQYQSRVIAKQIANEEWARGFAESTTKMAEMISIEGSEWGEAGDTPEASGAGIWGSISQKSINSWTNLKKSTLYKPIHDNKDKPSEKPNAFRESSFKLSLNQKIQLNKFLSLVSKTRNMPELYDVVNEALKAGIRINCAQGNKDTFANIVLFKACQLKLDPKIASGIVCKLVSKGAVFGQSYDKINYELKKSEIFKDHEVNLEKAKQEFDQYSNKFKEIAENAVNHGELYNLEIDNTTFYLECSENSVVNVTEVIGALGTSGGGIVKVGENEVEIEINDGIKNYANLSGKGYVILTLKGLEITLYHDVHNKDRVIVEVSDNDRKILDELSNEEKKEIWGSYLLGGLSIGKAIEKGYFEKSGSGKLHASETISPSVQGKVGEIIKSLKPSDITAHSLVNSLVSGVQLSKIATEQSRGRMHG